MATNSQEMPSWVRNLEQSRADKGLPTLSGIGANSSSSSSKSSVSGSSSNSSKSSSSGSSSGSSSSGSSGSGRVSQDIKTPSAGSSGGSGSSGSDRVSQDIKTPSSGSSGSSSAGGYTPAGAGSDYYASRIMSQGDQALLKSYGDNWNAATTQEEKDYWHDQAEILRNSYGYKGGGDGSEYIPINAPQKQQLVTAQAPDFTGLLDSWLETAKKQQEQSIDYATEQGVKELQRAREDAQEQFQTQQDQVSKDEAKALDNQALYAEARGDRGGIGQAQYGQIQATAMTNRRAINSARVKLATDTARQIADLRAQGAFEKADALLELTQVYLGKLVELQQWGAEYALDVTQFNAQLQQWQAEFDLAAKQWQMEYDQSVRQWQMEYDYTTSQTERELLAASGLASLAAGVRPSAQQQAAMGYTDAQIDAELLAYKLAQAAGVKHSSDNSDTKDKASDSDKVTAEDIYEQMYLAGIKPSRAYAYLIGQGYAQGAAEKISDDYEMMQEELAQWANDRAEALAWSKATVDEKQVLKLFGPVSGEWLAEQEAAGKIVSYLEDGWIRYRKTSLYGSGSSGLNFTNTKPGSLLAGLNNLR